VALGALGALAVPAAFAASPSNDEAPASISVVAGRDGEWPFQIVIVRGDRVYVAPYPGSARELPDELKPWAILKK
jgi:hypothetical protein